MTDPVETIKVCVRRLQAYSLRLDRARVKLNQNENPWDAPQAIKDETLKRLAERPWSRYPDFRPQDLHLQLAEFAGWDPEGIIAGNGSNELIQALLMVTIAADSKVLISEPTFALYRQVTTVLGGETISIPLTSDLTYDLQALRQMLSQASPAVTIICSPNNPTGCVIKAAELSSLLETSHGLVVVDEAYQEFAGETVLPLLRKHSNLVVFRTFSKAMALAGLRVGYLLAAPELTREVAKALLPYNLNVVSQIAAQVAVEMYSGHLQPLISSICSERDRLFGGLQQIAGLEPVPSRANFMLVRSTKNPREVFGELLRRDILVRDVSSYPMLADYFRVSVGRPDENDRLLAALREIFSG